MLLLTIATVMLAGGSLWAAMHYGRKAVSEASNANALASERSVVDWQVSRQKDDNAGLFYAANVGQDSAYEVTLVAWDERERTVVKADELAPFLPDDCHDGEPAGAIEFRLAQREQLGPIPVQGPILTPRPEPPPGSAGEFIREAERGTQAMISGEMDRRQREQVWVRIPGARSWAGGQP